MSPATDPLLIVNGLSLKFGGVLALDDVSLHLAGK
jgi:ABC-type branched-subunit amino acid transport system ATPase component